MSGGRGRRVAPVPGEDEVRRRACAAGLTVVEDVEGYRRRRRGRGFSYVDADGRPVGGDTRARLEALAVPPAWSDVRFAADPDAHVLATGVDDAGRTQYRYHPTWREVADEVKFERLGHLGARLGGLRRRVRADLRGDDPTRATLAAVVRLIDRSLIRVGNLASAREHGTHGATTLRADHVHVADGRIALCYPAKGGQEHALELVDPVLATAIEGALDDGADDVVFQVGDDRPVTAAAVNEYLRAISGGPFTAKELRTWGATVTVTGALATGTDEDPDAAVLAAIDTAAERLGDTRAVARASYVAPAVVAAHHDGSLAAVWRRSRRSALVGRAERTTTRILLGEPGDG